MVKSISAGVLVVLAGCSFLMDFDEETDLPCPCLPTHVCLVSTNRCIPKHSVDPFKSCPPDAETPDDLCPIDHLCYNYEGRGYRCLPKCVPSNYSTPESGRYVRDVCPAGTTCWKIAEGAGVCDEGECVANPNTCPPPQECVPFNGAGVCFTPCQIFRAGSCLGNEMCHRIGDTNTTACIPSGITPITEVCDDTRTCKQADDLGRALVCDRPENSTDLRRCLPPCPFGSVNQNCVAGETCQFVKADIDPQTLEDLGVCR
ncbi:MAG: hypothetical protein HY791_17685 [Deltaproteobacteria bacterium]|nr:hypothetical protein [Deltaproteobacteria bacterium]